MSSDLIENVDDSLADISTKKLNGVQRLLEAGLLFFTAFALFMILALLSFDQADPGWAQTGYQTPVRNLGGTSWSSPIRFIIKSFWSYCL